VLDTVNATRQPQPVPLSDGALAVSVPPHAISRPALHTQVWALHRQGWTAPAIAQQVGLSLRTVQRDLRTATLAGRRRRRDCGESGLTPSKPYLLERWNAGCYNAMRLCRDLRQRGYAGGYGVVAASARRVRQAQGLPPGTAARADPCQ
jgi:transposase